MYSKVVTNLYWWYHSFKRKLVSLLIWYHKVTFVVIYREIQIDMSHFISSSFIQSVKNVLMIVKIKIKLNTRPSLTYPAVWSCMQLYLSKIAYNACLKLSVDPCHDMRGSWVRLLILNKPSSISFHLVTYHMNSKYGLVHFQSLINNWTLLSSKLIIREINMN